MTDLERLCLMLEELGIKHTVSGPKLGVTTKVTIHEPYTQGQVIIHFYQNGKIQ